MKTKVLLLIIIILYSSCKNKSIIENSINYSTKQIDFFELELNEYNEDKFFTAKHHFPFRVKEIDKLYMKYQEVKLIFKNYNNLLENEDQTIGLNNFEIQKRVKEIILDSINNPTKKEYIERDIERIFNSDSLSIRNISNVKLNSNDSISLSYYKFILFVQRSKLQSLLTYYIPTSLHSYHKNFFLTKIDKAVVQKGEQIEAVAGIGEMTYVTHPKIYFNNKKIELDNNLVAIYKFKASENIGEHTIKVKVEQLQPDGTEQTIEKVLKYQVVDTICKNKGVR